MGYPTGIRPEYADKARMLADVAETRAETPEQRSDEAKDARANTRDRRLAVDYYLGHSHTKQAHVCSVSVEDMAIARAAVLQTLHGEGCLNNPLPNRLIERLFTAEERKEGVANYIDRITGQECHTRIGVPYELTGA